MTIQDALLGYFVRTLTKVQRDSRLSQQIFHTFAP
jgi:hypothetical protein